MGVRYEDLEEMCENLGDKLAEANDRVRSANGDLTGGDLEYVDKLSHSIKSLKTTMAMMDAEGGYSHDGYNNGYSGYMYDGNTRARGRRRDGMGRYTSNYRSYSRGGDDFADELRGLMSMAPDEKTRQDLQKMLSKMENNR